MALYYRATAHARCEEKTSIGGGFPWYSLENSAQNFALSVTSAFHLAGFLAGHLEVVFGRLVSTTPLVYRLVSSGFFEPHKGVAGFSFLAREGVLANIFIFLAEFIRDRFEYFLPALLYFKG